ncbi:MAG: PfkB family carbohydrate kinase [bacterium]
MFDVITIGGATQDIFIQTEFAKIITTKTLEDVNKLLCFDFGAKIEIDNLAFDIGGGAVNTAVNFSILGFNTSTIIKIGNDLNAKAILNRLTEQNVDKSSIIKCKDFKTGFSVILNSFEGERTVLTHRGANSSIILDEIKLEALKNTKWFYISSLSGDSNIILDEITHFAQKNNIKVGFNPGTRQLKRGFDDFKKILSKVSILVLNKSEAELVTKIYDETLKIDKEKCKSCYECLKACPQRVFNIEEGKLYIDSSIDKCIKGCSKCMELCPQSSLLLEPWGFFAINKLKCLKEMGPDIVVITDGSNGAQAFDGKQIYYAPCFPAEVVSTLGAGDAFASTFIGALMKEWKIDKALKLASINSASITQNYGAQSGLKSIKELENIANEFSNYKIIVKDVNIFN